MEGVRRRTPHPAEGPWEHAASSWRRRWVVAAQLHVRQIPESCVCPVPVDLRPTCARLIAAQPSTSPLAQSSATSTMKERCRRQRSTCCLHGAEVGLAGAVGAGPWRMHGELDQPCLTSAAARCSTMLGGSGRAQRGRHGQRHCTGLPCPGRRPAASMAASTSSNAAVGATTTICGWFGHSENRGASLPSPLLR